MRPDWKVGDRLEERELPSVDRLSLIRYAGASGDYNPIHTIDEEATRAGLPGIIQHGMLTMGQVGALFSPYLEQGFVEHFHTRFSGMLFLGDTLRIGGKVTAAERVGDRERFSFDLYAKTQDGRSIARCTLRFVVFD
jgi:acyl dehydratase